MRTTFVLVLVLATVLAGVTLWAQGQPAPATQPASGMATPPAASRPASQPLDPEAAAQLLIERLLIEQGATPVLPPSPSTAPGQPSPGIAPPTSEQPIAMPPGSMLVNRVGRLVKDPKSEWWLFSFESEGMILREAPVRILPNRWLESMEEISGGGTKPGIRFRVSGELTEYRGVKYLLLRTVLRERDTGDL